MMPGWGCDRSAANRIVKELSARQNGGKLNELNRYISERSASIEHKVEILSMAMIER